MTASLAYGTTGMITPEFYEVEHCSNLPLAASLEHRAAINAQIIALGPVSPNEQETLLALMKRARVTARQYRSKEGQ